MRRKEEEEEKEKEEDAHGISMEFVIIRDFHKRNGNIFPLFSLRVCSWNIVGIVVIVVVVVVVVTPAILFSCDVIVKQLPFLPLMPRSRDANSCSCYTDFGFVS